MADLSFISLALVLPALVATATPDAELLLMVKPQFEVGRDKVGTGGVVRDAGLRASAVVSVVDVAHGLGRRLVAATASPLPGPSGNVEYFVLLAPGEPGAPEQVRAEVERAVAEGPGGSTEAGSTEAGSAEAGPPRPGPPRPGPPRPGPAEAGSTEAGSAGAAVRPSPAAQPTGAGGPR